MSRSLCILLLVSLSINVWLVFASYHTSASRYPVALSPKSNIAAPSSDSGLPVTIPVRDPTSTTATDVRLLAERMRAEGFKESFIRGVVAAVVREGNSHRRAELLFPKGEAFWQQGLVRLPKTRDEFKMLEKEEAARIREILDGF